MIKLKHNQQLAFSPAYTFVFVGYASMLEQKLTHPCLDFGNHSEVVYLFDDSEPSKILSAQVFAIDKLGRCYTYFAYTEPDSRGKGYAVMVFEHLSKLVQSRLGQGLKAIYTSAVDENEAVQHVFAKTGREQYTAKFVRFFNNSWELPTE